MGDYSFITMMDWEACKMRYQQRKSARQDGSTIHRERIERGLIRWLLLSTDQQKIGRTFTFNPKLSGSKIK